MALLPPPAGAPRTAPTVRRGTKPQTPCTQGLRSASLSYRPPLAAAALHNPTAPAPSCRPTRPPTPSASPSFKEGQDKRTGRLFFSKSLFYSPSRTPLRHLP